jgi:hypothetical protein
MASSVHDIPREHLLAMLKDAVWSSGDRKEFERQGFSLSVTEDTALRDVNYRGVPLFDTQEEAILAHWEKYFSLVPK